MSPPSPWLAIAGALCFGLAICHSVLGERLIFRCWRSSPPVAHAHAAIIRASWHALSLCGLALGVIMWRVPLDGLTTAILSITFIVSAILIAAWTRFRHPGWIIMGVIGLLVLISRL